MIDMDDLELDKINRQRRTKGLPPLSRIQMGTALVSSPSRYDEGFNSTDFLIGYTTGIPMPSSGGMLGAMMHRDASRDSQVHGSITPLPYTPAPVYVADDPPARASDPEPASQHDSSSSSDYSSSSSYDSSSSSSDSGSSSSSGND